jgi:hypothetical protein
MVNEPKSKKQLEQDAQSREKTKYGKTVAQVRSRWGNEVKISAKGYISITGLLGTMDTPEKLISIDFVDQQQLNPSNSLDFKNKKLSEGYIRDTYLIFVTTERSDSLHWSDNTNSDNAEILRLVAMARLAISGQLEDSSKTTAGKKTKRNPFESGASVGESSSASSEPGTDIATQLASLVKMHKDGDLSAAEFKAAKKKLLGE